MEMCILFFLSEVTCMTSIISDSVQFLNIKVVLFFNLNVIQIKIKNVQVWLTFPHNPLMEIIKQNYSIF